MNSTGTFGQNESWSIDTPSSWKHPAVPSEILIDPLSMPSQPILDRETDLSDVLDSVETKNKKSEVRYLDEAWCGRGLFHKALFSPRMDLVVFLRLKNGF